MQIVSRLKGGMKMFKVCLAGNYPAGTLESFKEALPADQFEVLEAGTKKRL